MSNGAAYLDVLSNVDMPAVASGRGVTAEAPPGYRLNITVCDPVKQDQGMNAYITYKVTRLSFALRIVSPRVAVRSAFVVELVES